MGRRMRIMLSVLTCMISCVTLVSLTVSLYHVNSVSNLNRHTIHTTATLLSAVASSQVLDSDIHTATYTNRNTNKNSNTNSNSNRNGLSRSDFQRRRPPSSAAQSVSALETPDHDPSPSESTPSPSESTVRSAWKETTYPEELKAATTKTAQKATSGSINETEARSAPGSATKSSSPEEKTRTTSASIDDSKAPQERAAGDDTSSQQHPHPHPHPIDPTIALSARPNTEKDILCSSCRYSPIGPKNNIPCIQRMQLKIKMAASVSSNNTEGTNTTNSMTLTEAGRNIANQRPDYCGRCDPDHCSAADKHYWRFDAAGPSEVRSAASASSAFSSASSAFSSRTHYLQSIGPDARLPVSALQNLTAYFANPENRYPAKDYLFEFNPSLVQLPASQIPDLGDVGGGNGNDNGNDGAVYLASFRVSNMHNCVTDPDTILRMMGGNWKRGKAQVKDYLGLALLRADLTIVADTVVDAKEIVHKMQDPRLFVLHDQMYVGSYHRMTPLWLNPPVLPSILDIDGVTSNATIQVPNVWESDMTVWLRTFGACTKDREIQRKGKNLNFFVDADNRTMMEMFPKGPKEEIEMDVRCTKSAEEDPPGTFVFPNMSAVPLPSFGTVEELDLARERIFEPAITGDRGSYCCVPITVKGQRLLLGIAHSKTRYNHKQGTDAHSEGQIQANHFFSSFYAIQDRAPYNVVARSGKFCLGFAQDEDESDNPYTMMNVVPLRLMGRTFDCPRIHFVTGMVEKAGDPSKVIISYGINDCVPRLVVVDKAEIILMLFDVQARLPPSEIAATSSG